jgi:hypothetical protein
MVLLEVQMQAKSGFKQRLFAQTARFLQLHPQVLHRAVVVAAPQGVSSSRRPNCRSSWSRF